MAMIDDDLYRKIIECMPIACVDVCIAHGKSIILVRRKDKPAQNEWWLPGGRVLKGEKMYQTARRKALEEVGLDCFVGPLVHTAETIFPDGPYGVPVHSINSCYYLHPKNGIDGLKLDNNQGGWRLVNSVEPELHPYVRDCLKACGLGDI